MKVPYRGSSHVELLLILDRATSGISSTMGYSPGRLHFFPSLAEIKHGRNNSLETLLPRHRRSNASTPQTPFPMMTHCEKSNLLYNHDPARQTRSIQVLQDQNWGHGLHNRHEIGLAYLCPSLKPATSHHKAESSMSRFSCASVASLSLSRDGVERYVLHRILNCFHI